MMKVRRKSKAGLVTDEETYKKYYPELSKQYSYGQFIGDFVVSPSTHCIGTQIIQSPDGETRNIYLSVDEELEKFMFKGQNVFFVRGLGKLFMCDPILIADNFYVSCEFGEISVSKIPPIREDVKTIHTISFKLNKIPTDKLRLELLGAVREKKDDVTIIKLIKKQLREVLK